MYESTWIDGYFYACIRDAAVNHSIISYYLNMKYPTGVVRA